ncbi:4-hydroxy-tetrahydrodipicolinate reductase [Marinicella sp. S1101]|uniref:4-hydroxy-tetrahydrodipicolinate reductase n=1 Tax=Marinicella marina TaxID=2996016 RepID=UPI002260A42E|nr:4-hydroxy-tetrahydrodipicolinate reductase [Marinicella marina]MCX7554499.1 4-hydroxy-tetrahydrodipicolinate reductase [Marinicella marina]MDJ1140650.1 4-hydroxy-tetrahydrodipicolinate reductase [Marinicella marina]
MNTPIKVIISGVSGRIGRRLLKLVLADKNFQLVAGLVSPGSRHLGRDLGDLIQSNATGIQAIESLAEVKADVVIDFAQPEGFDELVDYCVLQQTALISGTTGLNQDSFDRIGQAAKYIPIMWTSNFSLNIQIMKNLLQMVKQVNPKAQFSITETHHIHKKDMPSGTAISLAQAVDAQSNMTKTDTASFKLGDVDIHAIRQGEVPGTHEVTVKLADETFIFKHEAHDPTIFAQGALGAAKWITGKPVGFYDLNAVLMG